MIQKDDLLDAMQREYALIRHLASKVNAQNADYRPTPGQRSMTELLQYLSFCGSGATATMIDTGWERYKEYSEAAQSVTWETFPAALDAEEARLAGLFQEISAEDFASREAKTPLSEILPLGRALLEVPMKWLPAYRMQLFLYLKESGLSELGTYNCWAGRDKPAEA